MNAKNVLNPPLNTAGAISPIVAKIRSENSPNSISAVSELYHINI